MCWPPMLRGVLTAPGVALTVPCADTAAQARVAKEEQARKALADGRLGLDLYGLRDTLAARGVQYVDAAQAQDMDVAP